jgi:hypothetical protein
VTKLTARGAGLLFNLEFELEHGHPDSIDTRRATLLSSTSAAAVAMVLLWRRSSHDTPTMTSESTTKKNSTIS